MDSAQALKIHLAIRAIDSALTAREALEAERRAIDKLQRELAERQSRLLRAKEGHGERARALALRAHPVASCGASTGCSGPLQGG